MKQLPAVESDRNTHPMIPPSNVSTDDESYYEDIFKMAFRITTPISVKRVQRRLKAMALTKLIEPTDHVN